MDRKGEMTGRGKEMRRKTYKEVGMERRERRVRQGRGDESEGKK